jgi:hypothetical protein
MRHLWGVVVLASVVAAALAPSASARRVATVRLTRGYTRYDVFAGPVLVGGAPVWAQRGRDGHWRVYRAAKGRVSKLRTLPLGGPANDFSPLGLEATGRSLGISNISMAPLDPLGAQYRTDVDRLLLGTLGQPLKQLAGCYGVTACQSDPGCFGNAQPFGLRMGAGTIAWVQYCRRELHVGARAIAGGPLLIDRKLGLGRYELPRFAMAVSGRYLAFVLNDQLTVTDLSTGAAALRLDPPPGRSIAQVAIQADGTVAFDTAPAGTLAGPPYELDWASLAQPWPHSLTGRAVDSLRLVDNRLLFTDGPEFGPTRALVLDQIPDWPRRVISNFGARHSTLGEGSVAYNTAYDLDSHHAAWATQEKPGSKGLPSDRVLTIHVVTLNGP